MSYLTKRKFEERERGLSLLLVFLMPLLTLCGTLFRGADWRFDYLGEFKIQIAFVSAVLCLWCVFKSRWPEVVVFFLVAALNVALVSSRYHLTSNETKLPPDHYKMTFLYQDLKTADRKAEQIRDELEKVDADIVFWANVPVEIYRDLNAIKGAYHLQNQSFDKHGAMMLIMSRSPGTARGQIGKKGAGIWVSRVIGNRKLIFAMTDLGDPWSKKAYEDTAEKVNDLVAFARKRDDPVVLIGGFGASGWSRLLDGLETEAGLQTENTVFSASSSNAPFLLRRPTDFIYAHPGIEVSDLRKTDGIGTARNGLTGTIKIAPARKELEFFEMEPTVSEEKLLQPPL